MASLRARPQKVGAADEVVGNRVIGTARRKGTHCSDHFMTKGLWQEKKLSKAARLLGEPRTNKNEGPKSIPACPFSLRILPARKTSRAKGLSTRNTGPLFSRARPRCSHGVHLPPRGKSQTEHSEKVPSKDKGRPMALADHIDQPNPRKTTSFFFGGNREEETQGKDAFTLKKTAPVQHKDAARDHQENKDPEINQRPKYPRGRSRAGIQNRKQEGTRKN